MERIVDDADGIGATILDTNVAVAGLIMVRVSLLMLLVAVTAKMRVVVLQTEDVVVVVVVDAEW